MFVLIDLLHLLVEQRAEDIGLAKEKPVNGITRTTQSHKSTQFALSAEGTSGKKFHRIMCVSVSHAHVCVCHVRYLNKLMRNTKDDHP